MLVYTVRLRQTAKEKQGHPGRANDVFGAVKSCIPKYGLRPMARNPEGLSWGSARVFRPKLFGFDLDPTLLSSKTRGIQVHPPYSPFEYSFLPRVPSSHFPIERLQLG
jgi:hypothetical protein